MSLKIFVGSFGIPAVFLIVATAHHEDKTMKGVFITLAYIWLTLCGLALYAWNDMSRDTGVDTGVDSFAFGLAFVIISIWEFALISSRHGKNGKSGNE